jgi:hypothetical protein
MTTRNLLSMFLLILTLHGCNERSALQPNKDAETKDPHKTTNFPPATNQSSTSGFKVKSITASGSRFCAIDLADEMWCWGENTLNESGGIKKTPSLGIGSNQSHNFQPEKVVGNKKWKKVTVSNESSCAIDQNDELYCWGRNRPSISFTGSHPHLGLGSNNDIIQNPTQVVGGRKYSDIYGVQGASSYFVARALDNTMYEIGEKPTGKDEPTQIILSGIDKFFKISISGEKKFSALDSIGFIYKKGPMAANPQSTTVKAIKLQAVAEDAYCVISDAQELYCYGNNKVGANWPNFIEFYDYLGVTTAKSQLLPFAKIPVLAGLKFKAIAGQNGHICAIDSGDALWCWGKNFAFTSTDVGILGTGSSDAIVLQPSKVMDKVSTVTVGAGQICAITNANKLKCFGENRMRLQSGNYVSGVLGTGSKDAVIKTAQDVEPTLEWKDIHIFSNHWGNTSICGIDTNDILYCWGNNGMYAPEGYLGVGSKKTVVDRPMKVQPKS